MSLTGEEPFSLTEEEPFSLTGENLSQHRLKRPVSLSIFAEVPMSGPADHWPPTVGAFWFHYWLEFWLQFWAASIAAQRAAYLGAQLGAKVGRNAGRPQLHIVRD